ncbi:hypothetical protein HY604_02695 [Candidatus Peregrinibacteria bacterium]|nr:hypothetical protein [Candidatus Peregrinibacteria bacterium]
MNKTYKFQGKALFIVAAVICILSFILAPVGIVFLYMAFTAKITLTDDRIIYKMLRTFEIPYSKIAKLTLKKLKNATYYVQNEGVPGAFVNFATVLPLEIEYRTEGDKTKKIRFSSNYFENREEILKILEEKSGIKVEVEQ